MALNPNKIVIVGCGPGSPRYLMDAARQAVARAEVLAGSRRLLELFPDHPDLRIVTGTDLDSLLEAIAEQRAVGRNVAVLVSGDPGLFSLAAKVVRRFGRELCEVIPGVSSVQVAFARLGLDWAEARLVSAHGRMPQVTAEELFRHAKIAILAGTAEALRWAAQAAGGLQTSHEAYLCENLTLQDERVRPVTAEELAAADASSLSIILLIRRELVA
jgi:cobalt-precorrin-7 (C5)-methyltransferase